MSYVFNPGYIGPNPPCCDPCCTDKKHCPNAQCGPCPGPQSDCGGCSPPSPDGQPRNYNTDIEACSSKKDEAPNQSSKEVKK